MAPSVAGAAGTAGEANSGDAATPRVGGTLTRQTRSLAATASRESSCGCQARRRVAEGAAPSACRTRTS